MSRFVLVTYWPHDHRAVPFLARVVGPERMGWANTPTMDLIPILPDGTDDPDTWPLAVKSTEPATDESLGAMADRLEAQAAEIRAVMARMRT